MTRACERCDRRNLVADPDVVLGIVGLGTIYNGMNPINRKTPATVHALSAEGVE
jgi:hypothetical protein